MIRPLLTALMALYLVLLVPISAAQTPTLARPQPQWDGKSRFTILVMGLDRRPAEGDSLSFRSDTLMLVSLDPQTQHLGILSIPRDIHVSLGSDAGLVRVNTLLLRGENVEEGYGPYMAMDVLQANLGLFIDAYIVFDFSAFITFIDAIGGVDVTTDYTINDPTYPGMNYDYDPFYLPRGSHTLDGETALMFARTRHGDNDYVRGQRQLQVVNAIRTRLEDRAVLAGLVARSPMLYSELTSNVSSNMGPEQVVYLGLSMMTLDRDDIHSGAINEQYSTQYFDGSRSVRVPDWSQLGTLLTDVFGPDYAG